jgi:hypothetical protein
MTGEMIFSAWPPWRMMHAMLTAQTHISATQLRPGADRSMDVDRRPWILLRKPANLLPAACLLAAAWLYMRTPPRPPAAAGAHRGDA